MKKHYRHENNCLNCGTTLEGKYCHNCGQENLEIKESFGHMMNHAISDYFHFDHQFFHTLKPLLFKPGFLTNEYMAGRRVQYLHPVKMYIFISLVYFLLFFQQKGGDVIKVDFKEMTTEQMNAAVKQIQQNQYIPAKAKKEAIDDLYKDNGYKVINNKVVKDTSKMARDRIKKEKADPHMFAPTAIDTSFEQYTLNQHKMPAAKRDGWFERYYNQKAYAINKQKINIKEVVEEGLKHNFPKVMFLLLPLFALILRITFYRNKKFYVEHLIYSFHLHCFIFLFLTILMILKFIIPESWDVVSGWLAFGAVIAITWYIYKSLRVVYHRSRWRTITKMIGMSLSYSFVFFVCFTIFLILTIATAV
ncbi:DUF3667 domain-containing protein [Mucilaginibacter gotjawali]|uniref:Uncharacterized protein n=2 Tax=Mucilaginibacter gotjawali TaxID=1550579 RepID=A0A839S8K4_9SPHI|nr:DUF3667 domain-containing protein [Mucilaginibacter gotjawali]MBB3054136.1 hypothetical protein [Mucilaginibacter gotjawali]BAU54405.1 hypothetical protein MgSA37_02581 [Mucilaginibacter gotjawali]